MNRPGTQTLIIIAAVLAAAGGFWLGQGTWSGDDRATLDNLDATVLEHPRPIPAFSLTDHHGDPVSEAIFEGDWSLVFFGFTHCPDICPMTLQNLAAVRARLADGNGPQAGVVFVTVDPERDDPDSIAAYLEYYDEAFVGITGEPAAIEQLTREIGIAAISHPPDEHGNYNVDHTSAVFLIDPQGRLAAMFRMPHDPETLAREFTLIAGHRG